MTRALPLALALAAAPGLALAHGGHPPLPEAAHGGFHLLAGAAVAAGLVGLVALLRGRRR